MHFLNNKCWWVLWLVAVSSASEPIALSHGTAVITLFSHEGIVMASDGLQLTEIPTGDAKTPFLIRRDEAESKVAVCNRHFLCGMAGTNPITLSQPINIEYHFQKWLPIIRTKSRPSVRNYANAIQEKARITFKNMNIVMKDDEFWKSKIASDDSFIKIAVAGYTGEARTPEYCEVHIEFDRNKRQLIYPDIQCGTPTWTRPSSMINYVLSGHEKLINQSRMGGTLEFSRFTRLLPDAGTATRTLFPDSPPAINEIVAQAAVMIVMQGEFDPEHIGGTTRIGELINGKLPAVHPPLALTLGK